MFSTAPVQEWQWLLGALAGAPGDQVRTEMGSFLLLLEAIFPFQDVPLIDIFTRIFLGTFEGNSKNFETVGKQ